MFRKGGEITKKSLLTGSILAVCVVAVLLGVVFIPPLLTSAQTTSTTSSTVYIYGGSAVLQLPPGGGALASRPTTLQVDFWYAYRGSGVYFGNGAVLRIWLWVPASNSFVPVAVIQNSGNASLVSWLKSVVNGTPVAQNVITVSPTQLQINRTSVNSITANLTVPESIAIGDPFPATLKALNFTLPPLALELRGIGSSFVDKSTEQTPSGWSVATTTVGEPAWARVWIPQWLGANYMTTTGTMYLHAVSVYTPP